DHVVAGRGLADVGDTVVDQTIGVAKAHEAVHAPGAAVASAVGVGLAAILDGVHAGRRFADVVETDAAEAIAAAGAALSRRACGTDVPPAIDAGLVAVLH